MLGLAELAGIRWTPIPDAGSGVESLIPDAVREGPADLWHEFDLRAQAAEQAATTSTADLQMAFEALREILTAIADALDAD